MAVVAVTVVTPGALAVTSPFSSTEATSSLLLVQVRAASVSVSKANSCCCSPVNRKAVVSDRDRVVPSKVSGSCTR